MIEVKVHRDIKTYKEKIILGLTGKQVLVVVFAAVIAGLSYYTVYQSVPEIAEWLVIIILFPILSFQFLTIKTFSLFTYIRLMIRHNFSNSKKLYRPKQERGLHVQPKENKRSNSRKART